MSANTTALTFPTSTPTLAERAAFAAALAEFQSDLPQIGKTQTATVKTKAGGEYSYDYADLADITALVLPALTKHGLSFTAVPEVGTQGLVLRVTLLHKDGWREEGSYPLPDPANHSPQEIGSAITYARRYALTALTGVCPKGEDDDGQKAQASRSAPTQQDPISVARQTVWNLAKQLGHTDAGTVADDFAEWAKGLVIADATVEDLNGYADHLRKQLEQVPA